MKNLKELFITPPILFIASIILILLIHFYLNLIIFPSTIFLYIISYILTFIGIIFIISSIYSLMKNNTDIHPFRKPRILVTNFPFSISRNPIYLSFLLFLISLSLYLRSVLGFIPVIAFYFIIEKNVINEEEKIIYKSFGKKYLDYKNKVRRWI